MFIVRFLLDVLVDFYGWLVYELRRPQSISSTAKLFTI